jgi:hypothetical protein
VAPGTLDDTNLIAAFKPVEDGIARAVGLNDRDFVIVGDRPGVRVTFAQEKRGAGVYGVEIVLGRDARTSERRSRMQLDAAYTKRYP